MSVSQRRSTRRLRPLTSFVGQSGGDGPNTGKQAVTFVAEAPDGTKLRRRFFNGVAIDLTHGIAALLPPTNGHPWSLWTVAASPETMPDYVQRALDVVVFVPSQRKG
jgi:hypothetical protein